MTESMLLLLGSIGAAIAVLVQILKRTPVPTDRPKLVVTIIAIIVVIWSNASTGNFNMAGVDKMIGEIGVLVGAAIAFYEVVIKYIANLWNRA
jgi:hypothetical protein